MQKGRPYSITSTKKEHVGNEGNCILLCIMSLVIVYGIYCACVVCESLVDNKTNLNQPSHDRNNAMERVR